MAHHNTSGAKTPWSHLMPHQLKYTIRLNLKHHQIYNIIRPHRMLSAIIEYSTTQHNTRGAKFLRTHQMPPAPREYTRIQLNAPRTAIISQYQTKCPQYRENTTGPHWMPPTARVYLMIPLNAPSIAIINPGPHWTPPNSAIIAQDPTECPQHRENTTWPNCMHPAAA